jgi:thioredoxin 1
MDAATQETFDTVVLEASREQPVLVDFWGPACGPCLRMMPWVEKYAAQLAGRAQIVKVNTAENKRLAMRLGVMGLPAFALYHHGDEVARLNGDAVTPGAVTALVEKHVS